MEVTKKEYKRRLNLLLKALRSGDYQQVQHRLAASTKDGMGYCCLGVACEVAIKDGLAIKVQTSKRGKRYVNSALTLPKSVREYYGFIYNDAATEFAFLNGTHFKSLAELNDSGKFNFKEIASQISKNRRKLFVWA